VLVAIRHVAWAQAYPSRRSQSSSHLPRAARWRRSGGSSPNECKSVEITSLDTTGKVRSLHAAEIASSVRAIPISGEHRRWTLDRVFALFPNLKARERNLGFQLSGGRAADAVDRAR
jgi:hypothetical protein